LLTGRPPFEGSVIEIIRGVKQADFRPPRVLDASIDGALEAISLKAMALRPEDRYPSCRALADDIDRFIAGEPVTAWREPLSRQVGRWGKRHQAAMAAASVALVAGVIGLASVAGVQARANTRLSDANAKTKQALDQSEESRKQAEAVTTFLVQAFRSPDPAQDGRLVKVADVLERAGEKLDNEFDGPPAVQGKMFDVLGQTYWGLGLYDRA